MKRYIAALAVCAALTSPALADTCTAENAQQKAVEIATKLQAVAQQDINKFQEISTKMQSEAMELQSSGDMQALCDFYDKVLEDIGS